MMNDPNVTSAGDVGAVTLSVMAFFNILPSIAALLSVIWLVLRILESRTVQTALGKRAWIKEYRNDEDE